jgi:hypothetical protein
MRVLSELDYWCARRLPPEVWAGFLEDLIAGAYRAEGPTAADFVRCRELQPRYADLALGIVDASVVALTSASNCSNFDTSERDRRRVNHAIAGLE